jgi:hypothetical protein
MRVKNFLRNSLVEERRLLGKSSLMFVFVTVRGDKIGAAGRTVDGDLALGAAADGTNFFAFGGTIAGRLAFFADRTVQTIPLDFADTTNGNRNSAGYDGPAIKTKQRRLSPVARARSGHDDFVVKAACGDDQKKRPDRKKSETVEP